MGHYLFFLFSPIHSSPLPASLFTLLPNFLPLLLSFLLLPFFRLRVHSVPAVYLLSFSLLSLAPFHVHYLLTFTTSFLLSIHYILLVDYFSGLSWRGKHDDPLHTFLTFFITFQFLYFDFFFFYFFITFLCFTSTSYIFFPFFSS